MEFSEVLASRRSVRHYKTDMPLERSVIESLLEAATLAPSAHDGQPWEFFVVEGYESVSALAKQGKEWLQEQIAHNPTAGAVSQRQQLMDPHFELFHGAAMLVLVVSKSYEKQAVEDCGLAAYALMLAARDRMIGSCCIGSAVPWLNLHATKRQQEIPDGYCVVAPIVLGYPTYWPEQPNRLPPVAHWR